MLETATTSIAGQTTTKLPKIAWAVVIAAVVVRLLLQLLKSDNLLTDPDAYVRLSKSVAEGSGFSAFGSTTATAFRPPLFPFLLAVPQWCGLSTVASIVVVQLTSSAMLVIAAIKLAMLMRMRQRDAVFTACVVACDPLLLVYATLPMTEIISAAFLTWAAVFMLQIWQKLAGDTFHGIFVYGILAGCCFGFGGLCRPVLFVACALSSLLLFAAAAIRSPAFHLRELKQQMSLLHDRAERLANNATETTIGEDLEQMQTQSIRSTQKRIVGRLLAASLPAIVAAAILFPWVLRNAVYFEQFIPATTHGGYTLLLGNNPVFYAEVVNQAGQPRWQGDSLDQWNLQLEKDINADKISPSDEVARDRWMYARAKTNIDADKSSFYKACRLRIKRFWAIVPTAAVENGTTTKTLVGLFYAFIAVGLVAQLLLNIKHIFSSPSGFGRSLQPWFLWSMITAFVIMHSVYWTNTRMRAPLMPILIVLASLSYSDIARTLQGKLKKQNEDRRTSLPNSEAV
ncbi:MAG: hypothetical protein ABJZ55_21425 [Fuerstiella sp.]